MTDLNIIRSAHALTAEITDLVAERDVAVQQLAECREAAEIAKDEWEVLVEDLNGELARLHRQSVVVLPEDWENQVHQLGELCTPTAFLSLLRQWLVPPAVARPVYPTIDPELPQSAEEPPSEPPAEPPVAPRVDLVAAAPPVDPMVDTVSDLPIVPPHQDVLSCPNTPHCTHPGGVHVFTPDSPMLRCGVGGCPCGVPMAAAEDGGKPIGQEVTTDA